MDKTKVLLWKFICVSQMTLKPCFLGSCFFKTHTEAAFDSEKLDFHTGVWAEPKICCENSSVSVKYIGEKSHSFSQSIQLQFILERTSSSMIFVTIADFKTHVKQTWKSQFCQSKQKNSWTSFSSVPSIIENKQLKSFE